MRVTEVGRHPSPWLRDGDDDVSDFLSLTAQSLRRGYGLVRSGSPYFGKKSESLHAFVSRKSNRRFRKVGVESQGPLWWSGQVSLHTPIRKIFV